MATTRYSTSVTLCEDTSVNYELSDLLKQADPSYSAIDPARIKLYVLDSTTNKYVEVTTGFFTAVDKDTFTVDMAQLPNFNGIQKVRVLGTDDTGNTFVLDLQINVTPVNDAPAGADDVVSLASGASFVFGTADFGFTDPVEGNNFKSVVMTSVPASGTLTLNGVAVVAGQEIQAADIAAGKLVYTAPANAGGAFSLDFQVRDDGGTDGCGGNDLDLTPNTFTFNVPLAAKAVIGDRVWEDTNANGVQDMGEAGIAGVTVQLKDAAGNPVATTTTDGSGNYSFSVDPGTYTVSVATPAGYRVTESDMGPSDATDSDIDDFGNSAPVTVVAGETNTTVNAGLFRSAELGNRVWLDTNGNGQQDGGEAGVPGVLVRLYNAAGELVDGPVNTDANGEYLFTNLRPGTYSVQFDKTTLPAGYSFTTANVGSDVTDSDANVTDGKTVQTVLDSGESDRTWDAGIVANPGTITGSVLEDTNNDNVGDTPLPGVTVVLKDAAGNPVATTTTDANGNYSFPNVPAGNYTVVEQTPPGFLDVGDTDGGDPNVISVTVTPGQTNSGNVFVDERQPGVISGTVREDLDNNGTGDTPIAGATVVLKDGQGNPVATTTTDANGNYVFNNVPAGSYTVEETNKPGYTDVSDIDGGNPNQISVTLTPGQSSTGNDFVDERPATLGDRVWEDTNANGVQDMGEAGIAGVTVQLKDENGTPVATTTTDANGNYSFTVTPGTYSVAIVAPAGYVATTPNQGNDATDSDIDSFGNTGTIVLSSGENDPTVDAGLYRAAQLGDRVWLDTNGNGQQDGGEAGVAGVRVTLLDAAGNAVGSPLTTDANGNYLFTGLKPGTYSVQFDKTTLPAGYSFTTANVGSDVTDSDANVTDGKTVQTVLDSGESDRTWDAGIVANPGTITGSVLEDTNNDNVGDTPLPGVTVVLKDAAGNPVATTTTDANGNYSFPNVPAGNYTVVEQTPPGFLDVGDTDGGDPNVISVTVTPGQTNSGNVFVDERQPGVISGTVREDLDNNGTGDTPIAGATVVLKDGQGNPVATTTTDANGNYVFNNVPAGSYIVEETNKPGYTDVSDIDGGNPNQISVTLTPGQSSTGNDFVDERPLAPGVISGTVREDLDNNGTGDTPIAGATVVLKDGQGNPVATTTTDANGNYVFNNVPAGSYTVEETNKPGYTDVSDIDGGNPNQISVTLTPGQSSTGNDFVDERPATLGDRVWEDTNANGVQDMGEAGIAGVTVQLKDENGTPVATTTTDANGNYSFTVTPGTYSVAIVAPAGYVATTPNQGNDATDSDIDSFGNTGTIVLSSGENDPTVDAGLYRAAQLGDRVWLDTNGNGQQDGGEAGVAGVRVTLLDAAGNAVGSPLTTDANGNYLFTGLKPGTYSVQFDKTTLPAGYSFTTANVGSDVTDSDANVTDGKTVQTVLDSGESDRTWDAGIVANPGTITGSVLEDTNNDNVGDTPLPGVTVVLKDAAGNPVATTTTDANGNYSFPNVPAGNYTVVEQTPPGFLDVGDTDGGDPNVISVTVTPGQTNSGNVFVDERSAAIGDKVWLDSNANGVQDAGEAGIAGVTVKLLDSIGGVVSTSTTDASGNYLFSNLTPGDYAVQVVLPAGYFASSKDQGGNDALDSDIDPTTGKTINTTLSAGETDRSWDAGLYQKASIGDRVWLDANKNGVQDSGEAGVAGVTVKLLNAAGTEVATATTDANGNYLFQGLVPGNYSVRVVAPTGYTFTTPDQGGNDGLDSDVNQSTGATIQTTLSSGENDLSWDAGLVAPSASYGDRVWLDKNANGVQDAGEAGLAGVTVKLLNSAGGVVATTTTDANGNYLFNNLTPGDYAAQVVAPTGYFVSAKDQGGNDATDSDFDPTTGKTVSTTLVAGENDLSWDAGLYQKASIGDKVWADCDNDGLQDAGEAGVPGVTVKLLDASGNVIATTLTDGNGNYLFKDLMPGTYSVQFVAPTGYTFTTKDVGSNDAIDSDVGGSTVIGTTNLVTNGSFENGTTGWCGNGDGIEVNTAGAFGVSAVTGAKVLELDANCTGTVTGVYQDIATVAGQSYQLYLDVAQRAGYAAATNTVEVFWEGVKIATIDPTSTALTKYTLTVTAADASSRLEFREQAGDDDSVGGIIDNVALYTIGTGGQVGTTIQTTLESGENDLTWDAGLTVKPVTACFDFSGNMATDGTDGNLLCYSNNGISVNASALSRDKASGAWAKAYLGAYGGGLGVTDGSEGTGYGNTHTVDNNGTRDNYVLFEFSQSVVVDKAYLGYVVGDSDAKVWIGTVDGAFNSHINLSDAVLSSMGFTEVNATTLTSARWADLNANGFVGNVMVVAANPGQTDDYFKIEQVVVSTPSAFCATDVSIGDRVWNDANMNGVQDAGEAGISGVTVKLLNSAGTVVTTTTTDASGNYLFSKLAAGDYKIQVVTPNGYTITGKDQGGNDAADSDIDSTGTTGIYTLTQGSNNLSVDAGFYCPPVTGKIGDRVWEDLNFNGIQDAGEAGIKGVAVKLLNSAGAVVATTTTDASGNYLFSNVNAGNYRVQVVTPTGYYVTKQDQAGWNGTDSAFGGSGYTGTISLAAGQTLTKVDAGLYRKACVGDRVWMDFNNNGWQDSGEGGAANVTVKLLNAAGTVVATTTTDGNGCYGFSNIDPGQYSLQFDKSSAYYYTGKYDWWGTALKQSVNQSSYQWTTKDAYSNAYDAYDSDVARVSSTYFNQGSTDKFTLVSGEYDNTLDAGICPIVIDLDGNGIQTISRENADGSFDLLGTGIAVKSGWLSGGDGFLAIDSNGNGRIDDVSELFGGNAVGQGFAKLSAFDSNGDGLVDRHDAGFGELKIWVDANGNHQTEAGELMGLTDAGVASLNLDYFALPAVDEQGNLHLERSVATLADGRAVDMTDVYFNVDAQEAAQAGAQLPTMAELLGDDTSLDLLLGVSVAAADVAAVAAPVSDAAVAALGQLSGLYQEQQYALMAA